MDPTTKATLANLGAIANVASAKMLEMLADGTAYDMSEQGRSINFSSTYQRYAQMVKDYKDFAESVTRAVSVTSGPFTFYT